MRVTLIKPRVRIIIPINRFFAFLDAVQPVVLGILSALTPPDVEVTVYDSRFGPIPFDEPTDLVAITVDTTTAMDAYQISAEFRSRGVPVVMGGLQATLLPEEVSQYADAIVIGEAEGSWPQVIEDARCGRLKSVYTSSRKELTGIKVDRKIFERMPYLNVALVEFGRGCLYQCDFCCQSVFYGHSYRHRPVQEVVDEIKALGKGVKVLFPDENIYASPKAAKQLFKAIAPLGIQWVGGATLEVAKDRECLRLMAESGCARLLIGFESLKESSLARMKKFHNARLEDVAALAECLSDHGIRVVASFVFGYDEDRPLFDETVDFAISRKFYKAYFNYAFPYPGTPLYERLLAEERLAEPHWWLNEQWGLERAAFDAGEKLSGNEMAELCLACRKRFYGFRSIWMRMDRRMNCKTFRRTADYLLSNLFYPRK